MQLVVPPMLIWIASFPRSGNTFLRVILESIYGVPSYTIYANETQGKPWSGTLPCPATALSEARLQDLTFIKTHELCAADALGPALYVVRDGRDAYVSYAHFAMRRHPDGYWGMSYADVLRMLIESRDHFGGWSRHVEAWLGREAPTAVLRFEEMLAEPATAAARACRQLGLMLPTPPGRLPNAEELRPTDPYAFRKGKAGSWKEEMPAELEELFWNLHGAMMSRVGYCRNA